MVCSQPEEKLKSRKDEGKYQIRNFETRFEYSEIELLHTTSFTRKEDFECGYDKNYENNIREGKGYEKIRYDSRGVTINH